MPAVKIRGPLSRKRLESMVKERGLWEEYVRLREEEKGRGTDLSVAWRMAAERVLNATDPADTGTAAKVAADRQKIADLVERRRTEEAEKEIWAMLYRAAEGRRASNSTIREWAFNRIQSDLASIAPEEVPCPGALTVLQELRRSTVVRSQAVAEVLKQSKADRDQQAGKIRESHRSIRELLDDFKRGFEAAAQARVTS